MLLSLKLDWDWEGRTQGRENTAIVLADHHPAATTKALALLPLIYTAAGDPSHWEAFLAAFAEAIHTRVSIIWISRRQPDREIVSVSHGLSQEAPAQMSAPSYLAPWMLRVDLNTVPVGKILRSHEICPDEVLIHDESYRSDCLPAAMHYSGGVILERTASITAGMTTNRPREAGPLTDDELATWQSLIPHLRSAVALSASHNKVINERDAMMRYFDDVGHAVFLVSAANQVLACNGKATAFVNCGDCLRLEADGTLSAVDRESNQLMQQAIQLSCAGTRSSSAPLRLKLHRSGKTQPTMLATVLPLGSTDRPQLGPDTASAVIYVVDLEHSSEFETSPLRSLFGFTEAEARLANSIATGLSLAEAASKFNVSINTVRTHLQRVLVKAGLRRQTELAILVIKLCRTK